MMLDDPAAVTDVDAREYGESQCSDREGQHRERIEREGVVRGDLRRGQDGRAGAADGKGKTVVATCK